MKKSIIFAILSISIGVILGISVYLYHYFYPQEYVKTENGEYVHITVANQQQTFPVTQQTQFVVEHYYVEDKRTLTEKIGNIPTLIGCDKEGVENYLSNYMSHLSAIEKSEGLTSYRMISYKDDTIHLRKTYEKPQYDGYYAQAFNGYLVIMNGDKKTVYEYTNISIHILPKEIQDSLDTGYYLEKEEDVYNFLEAYSS